MSEINAFPAISWKSPDGMIGMDAQRGMTPRDYFAAQALAGFLANADSVKIALTNAQPGQTRCDVFADLSYDCADAMLKRREV